jgi:hypothetical protein
MPGPGLADVFVASPVSGCLGVHFMVSPDLEVPSSAAVAVRTETQRPACRLKEVDMRLTYLDRPAREVARQQGLRNGYRQIPR